MRPLSKFLLICLFAMSIQACQSGKTEKADAAGKDSLEKAMADSPKTDSINDHARAGSAETTAAAADVKAELPVVMVYNFHVTNRCVSCIAIEEATTKTLNTYFANEIKQGRIRRQIIDVDDKANQKIAEKYEAFGSGLYITRIYKGKETTTDLTGDGFKFAKNKEERFIEILKSKITEYLK